MASGGRRLSLSERRLRHQPRRPSRRPTRSHETSFIPHGLPTNQLPVIIILLYIQTLYAAFMRFISFQKFGLPILQRFWQSFLKIFRPTQIKKYKKNLHKGNFNSQMGFAWTLLLAWPFCQLFGRLSTNWKTLKKSTKNSFARVWELK